MFELNMPMDIAGCIIPSISHHTIPGWDAKKFREWATNYVREENERRIPLGLGKLHLAWIRDKRTGRFV
jgi:hypothetical protein